MKGKIGVLVVDDSAFARVYVSKNLATDPEIEIVGIAKDGAEAVEQVKNLRPDVVTLDVTMPNMDGLQALEHIMKDYPTPVVMLSALTGEHTAATVEALEKGAVDFFLKGSAITPTGNDSRLRELIDKVKMASNVSGSALRTRLRPSNGVARTIPQTKPSLVRNKVLVIGSSTGGPRALSEIIPQLPENIPASILIVQHMPAGFTQSLAQRLNDSSRITVKEAEQGDRLERGKALVAPGGYHMEVGKNGNISLNEGPLVHSVRPSVDVTMISVAKYYGNSIRAVVLTGMGSDGSGGARAIKNVGGKVIVEHESTCAVYGMPRSVAHAGLADNIVKLPQIADEIVRICSE